MPADPIADLSAEVGGRTARPPGAVRRHLQRVSGQAHNPAQTGYRDGVRWGISALYVYGVEIRQGEELSSTGRSDPVTTTTLEPSCAVCPHDSTAHDSIGLRYCSATVSGGLDRECACARAADHKQTYYR
ncbi:RGCVC family protein [Nocardia acidivorans]|uniref:RGCVC family protein n=1 Tax=Nocardia acidivorans TaxID=404580 RepID=UPI0035A223E5